MSKYFALVIIFFALASAAATKLDPALDMALTETSKAMTTALSKSLNTQTVGGEKRIDCLVRARDTAAVRVFITQNGGTVRSVIGEIMTAWVPADLLQDLAEMPQVVYIEASKRLWPKLGDSYSPYNNGDGTAANPGNVRVVTQANLVQAGTGSGLGGAAYNGTGVIVGVVDSGIACTNSDFNDSSGTTRIISYWDQSLVNSTCTGTTGVAGVPAEVTGTGGCEYVTADITAGKCMASPDSDGHGTHVTGIAASINSTYTGIAPGASIIAVKQYSTDASSGGTFSSSVIDGVNYIFRKAQKNKKPAVVNLSLGTSLGAHDDTSLLEQGLNSLLSGVQGRAIVNAQGNENLPSSDSGFATLGGIHALVNVTSGSPKAFEYLIRGNEEASRVNNTYGGLVADIWLASGGSCTITVNAFSGTQKTAATIATAAVSAGGSSSNNTDGTAVISINFTDSANANNGKQHAQITITAASSSAVTSLDNYTYDLIFTGACSGHVWLYPDQTSLVDFTKTLAGTANSTYGYTYVAGDSNYTTTIPATASSVIAAGSFMGRQFWTNINGTTMNNLGANSTSNCATGYGGTVSAISLFSSLGPTADGRVKPDITAPGEPVLSTLSSAYSPRTICKADAIHFADFGTSMSSPAVAGTIALLLQRNGCLTPAQIKSLITGNVTTDSNTSSGGALPSNTWGSGKVNALTAVAATTSQTCAPSNVSEDGAGKTAYDSGSTDNSGSSGCSLIRK